MKHLAMVSTVLLFSAATISFAQSPVPSFDSTVKHKNILSIYPANIFLGDIRVGYEHLFCKHIGLGVIPAIGYTQYWDDRIQHYKSFHLIQQARYYFSRRAPNGFYAGEFLGFYHAVFDVTYPFYWTDTWDTDYVDVHYKVNSIQLGALIGYRLVIRTRFTADIYAGIGPNFPLERNYLEEVVPWQTKQLSPHYGLNAGYMF